MHGLDRVQQCHGVRHVFFFSSFFFLFGNDQKTAHVLICVRFGWFV